jgi:[ribosomal protein S5]-alanine N-acetyltransferase
MVNAVMTDRIAHRITPVEGPRVILRPVRITDALDIYRNGRSPEISTWSGPSAHSSLEGPVGQFILKLARYTAKASRLLWYLFYHPRVMPKYSLAIVLKQTGRAIGVVTLSRLKDDTNCADVGFWVGTDYWGQGLTTDALQLAIRIGFEQLDFSRIDAWTFEKNVGSKRVMEKCGLKLESVIKDAYVKYNEPQTRLNYSIRKCDYDAAARIAHT